MVKIIYYRHLGDTFHGISYTFDSSTEFPTMRILSYNWLSFPPVLTYVVDFMV